MSKILKHVFFPITYPFAFIKNISKSNARLTKNNFRFSKDIYQESKANLQDIRENREKVKEEKRKYREMQFENILSDWGLEREMLPKLKKILFYQMIAYAFLFVIGLIDIYCSFFTDDLGEIAALGGLLICIITGIAVLTRLYRLTILNKERYYTFAEFLGFSKNV